MWRVLRAVCGCLFPLPAANDGLEYLGHSVPIAVGDDAGRPRRHAAHDHESLNVHDAVADYITTVRRRMPSRFRNVRVLEVGSLDINGSVREFFNDCEYLGIDLGEGPGVDRVCHVQKLVDRRGFDVVISTSALEHDRHWESSLAAMYRLLRVRGLLLVTAAGPNFPEHGTTRTSPADAPFTNDWYRALTMMDVVSILPREMFSLYELSCTNSGRDLLFHAVKR